ncbi:MAG: SPFH domain-containing protein [Nannocystaceae bacterium]|nr:SPFH domain-containing protein [Nannocystaceae bacterium]
MIAAIGKFARWVGIATLLAWLVPLTCTVTIGPDEIGVRQSNVSGVAESDLEPGWAWRLPGLHRIIVLPKRYAYLDYTSDEVGPQQPLQIRTKDNNIVVLDVSVPYHIKPGEGWSVVQAGNHQIDANGVHRYQRLAEETTVSVLREQLAELTSADFYSTDRRLAVSGQTLGVLNESLATLHLEASTVLIRAVQFRPEYEEQLQQIQLNEQKKLLDAAAQTVAVEQQKLDNFQQGTQARAASAEQKWIERRANLERAYQVGFIEVGDDTTAGAARSRLTALTPGDREALAGKAATMLELDLDGGGAVDDRYLLGIKNVQAETLQYDQRVRTEADGVAARLVAEADLTIAKVVAEFEAKRNALLGTVAGRAYIAWQAADNVKFASELSFASGEGVPSVLRLRKFTLEFMGEKGDK